MALPASKTPDELRNMSEARLQRYFERHACYCEDAPTGQGYSYAIRFGSTHLYSDCTADLREQFFAIVQNRRPKLAHQWVDDKCIHCERELPRCNGGSVDGRTFEATCHARYPAWNKKVA